MSDKAVFLDKLIYIKSDFFIYAPGGYCDELAQSQSNRTMDEKRAKRKCPISEKSSNSYLERRWRRCIEKVVRFCFKQFEWSYPLTFSIYHRVHAIEENISVKNCWSVLGRLWTSYRSIPMIIYSLSLFAQFTDACAPWLITNAHFASFKFEKDYLRYIRSECSRKLLNLYCEYVLYFTPKSFELQN